ncbi:MAG: signal peptide peptidase SppA [Deltaproteobacteria bacterium]|nr:signal peptide peptidase SppA [Deltaproteobacteria bacterium]
MKLARKALKFFILLNSAVGFSSPWNRGIEVGTSAALSYGSRNLFTNPAGMAFEKELNGLGLLSSFTYGSTFGEKSEFSLSSNYSLFGFGYEKLNENSDSFSRYQVGVAYPISQELFWGTRFSLTSSEISSLSNDFGWDLGFQYRPFSSFSLGLILSELNQSTINGIKSPTIFILGAAYRPISWLTLTADVETPSNSTFKTTSFQTNLTLEPLTGFRLFSGYQSDHRFQIGIQWDLERASLFSVYQPSPKETVKNGAPKYIAGFQTALKPLKSTLEPKRELFITLDETLTEEGREGTLFSKARPSLVEILNSIQEASTNQAIEKITLKVETFPLGLGAAEEISEALLKARNQGKTVDVFLSMAKTKEYLIASSATHIYLESSGEITLLGSRVSKYFIKGTLDKAGIEGEFLAKGDYKSAPEFFMRKDSSRKSQLATQHEIKELDKSLLEILGRTRKISQEKWNQWLDVGMFSSQDALKYKLIDNIGSYKETRESDANPKTIYPSTLYHSSALNLPNRISVITASGNILQRKNRLLSLAGQSQITPEHLESLFEKALRDNRTKAIVFRVSSSGGEVLASEEIASLVAKAKKQKPVIVSMGDMAASGGYFISAPSDKIFSNQLTLTGSIGVFLGKFNLAGLYQKLDIKKEIWGNGPWIGSDSEHKPWTKNERALMERRLLQYYDSFVDFVAKQRKLTKDAAEKAAQGRVWLGVESLGLGLVDKTGGLLEAIEAAKVACGDKGAFVVHPVRESLSLFEALSEEATPGVLSDFKAVVSLWGTSFPNLLAKMDWISQHPYLYLALFEE